MYYTIQVFYIPLKSNHSYVLFMCESQLLCALLVCGTDEPIYNSVWCFTQRSLEGRLKGISIRLLQTPAVSLSRNV